MINPAELYGRAARIVVGTKELVSGDAGSGLRVTFSIDKTLKPEPNKAEVRIWNLSKTSRATLEQAKDVPVQIEAGYTGAVSLLFLGNLREAYSVTEGPDIVTTLSSGDGAKAYKSAQVNASFPKNTPVLSAVQKLAKDLGVLPGNLADLSYRFDGGSAVFSNGAVFSGNAAWELTTLLASMGKEWSIQDGAIQVLDRNKTLKTQALLLSSDTGMVDSPSINSKGELSVRCLMIPDVTPGRLMVLDSQHIKGNFRIEKCQYTGDTHGEDWTIAIDAKKL